MNSPIEQNNITLLGPFSLTSFNQKAWEEIQSKLSKHSLICGSKDLFPESLLYLQLLNNFNSSSNLEDYFGDLSIKSFFLNRLIPRITNNIRKSKSANNDKTSDVLKQCLRQVVLLWIKTLLEGQTELTDSVVRLLKVAQSYSYAINHAIIDCSIDASEKVSRFALFNDFIESLGKEKSLPQIFELVNDSNKLSQSLTMMTSSAIALGNLSFVIPKESAIEYMSKVQEVISQNLFHRAESYIDNLTEKDIMPLLRAYKLLLRRVFCPSLGRHKEIYLLKLHLCSVCLKSDIPEKRELGLKILNMVIIDFKNPHLAELKSLAHCEYNQALHRIFGELYRDEVGWKSKQSLELFRYMFEQNLLTSEDFKTLPNALNLLKRTQEPFIKRTFKKVSEADPYILLLDSMVPIIMSNFETLDANLMDLFHQIYEASNKSKEVSEKISYLYWEILAQSGEISDGNLLWSIYREIKDCFEAENYDVIYVTRLINDCFDQVEKDLTKLAPFRIIGFAVTHYIGLWWRGRPDDINLVKLLAQKKVLDLFIAHIRSFKQRYGIEKNSADTSKLSYETHISMRIHCLANLFRFNRHPETFLTYETLTELWEIFIEQAPGPSKRDQMLKLLNDIAKREPFNSCISLEALRKFFIENLIRNKGQYHLQHSKEGALCFQGIFRAANESLKGIWKDPERPYNPDFVVKVHPNKLEGYEELWNFTVHCEDRNATEEIVGFLANILFS